ncbi:hypothetical protein Mpet_1420 [Methanolacinia petrolearia DSM 11571]|uniref:Uncharacterized protein n=1 Tax=Methanolacinia petrolearia (strain DSM 11571 / OCM 486 / SEBR 4847) TaxID=679926 RepID=E1RFF0_METP4|nr:hypothetical protein [Methanolacinia petrolearia]ADN36180.1 hypothetical protein Mpet_1420 [Methanolacinia petrolearia DSM 11571]
MSLRTLIVTRMIKSPGGEETIKGIFEIGDSPEADATAAAVELMNTIAENAVSGFAKDHNLPDKTTAVTPGPGEQIDPDAKKTENENPGKNDPTEGSEFTCEECGSRINSNESRLSQIFTNRNLCRQCLGKVEQ